LIDERTRQQITNPADSDSKNGTAFNSERSEKLAGDDAELRDSRKDVITGRFASSSHRIEATALPSHKSEGRTRHLDWAAASVGCHGTDFAHSRHLRIRSAEVFVRGQIVQLVMWSSTKALHHADSSDASCDVCKSLACPVGHGSRNRRSERIDKFNRSKIGTRRRFVASLVIPAAAPGAALMAARTVCLQLIARRSAIELEAATLA